MRKIICVACLLSLSHLSIGGDVRISARSELSQPPTKEVSAWSAFWDWLF